MNLSGATNIRLLIAALAAAMAVAVSMPGVAVTAEDDASDTALARRPEHAILLRRGTLDTRAQRDADTAIEDLLAVAARVTTQSQASPKELRLIQFPGAVRRPWIERLRLTGAEIVGYVPNNSYLIRGTAEELARVASLDAGEDAGDHRPIRWMSRLLPLQKIAPELDAAILHGGAEPLDVQIQLLDAAGAEEDLAAITALASGVSERRFLRYVVLTARLPAVAVVAIAGLTNVVFIEPKFAPTLQDERSLQIIAGNLTADGTKPTGPGYVDWLAARGLATEPDYVIDVADSGIDRGSTGSYLLHPDFLDAQEQSRVVYNKNYAGGTTDKRGHGTMVASVAAGLGAANRRDEAGYLYGLGVDPRAKLGSSRIFQDNGNQPTDLSYSSVVSAAYVAGARISNNSWGNRSNVYDFIAQEYDALVRDAQPAAPGNQEIVIVFSTGNGGAGGAVSSPGTAKNVITVAASESYRPEGEDACNLDGAGGVGPAGADSALDMLRFSSGGPTFDGRAKPDLTAPGTHIFGAASQASGFFAVGLCPGAPILRPEIYSPYFTWSSGTSFAAPHVSGAASLLRRHVTQNGLLNGLPPSPAMTKALLINSASYLTGEGAGGSLPHERQGYGLVNLRRAFENGNRKLVDQSHLFTESGQSFELRGSLADRSQPLRVNLAWTDAPGMPLGAALVNDLDLEVRVGETTVGTVTLYRGNRFSGPHSTPGGEADRLNNIEAITIPAEAIPAGAGGNFTITVRAANIAGNAVPGNDTDFDQDFALVATNLTNVVSVPPPPQNVPVVTVVTYVKKVLTITGRDFTAAARVEINGNLIDLPFTFDAATNSLRIKLKAKKLKLIPDAENRIVVMEGNERSQPFVVRV